MSAPTPADMSSCDQKVRCKTGEYAGQAYDPNDPCAGQTSLSGLPYEWQGCEEGCVDTDDKCATGECGATLYYTFAPYDTYKRRSCTSVGCDSIKCSGENEDLPQLCSTEPSKSGQYFLAEGYCYRNILGQQYYRCPQDAFPATWQYSILQRVSPGGATTEIDRISYVDNYGCGGWITGGDLTAVLVPRIATATSFNLSVDVYNGGIPGCRVEGSPPGACTPPDTFAQRSNFTSLSFGAPFETSNAEYVEGWAARDICDLNPAGHKTVFEIWGGGYDYAFANWGTPGAPRTVFDASSSRPAGGTPHAIGLVVTLAVDWTPGFFDRGGEDPTYEPDTVVPAGSRVVYGLSGGGGYSASACNWEGMVYRNPEISFNGLVCIDGPVPEGF